MSTLITDFIPRDSNRRPGLKLDWEFITVHNTGNPESTAENERAWLTNPSNKRQASWHYVICEDTIIQAIPVNEVAWHAGDGLKGPGNRKSIGIEICESGDFEKSVKTAAVFIAELLKMKGLGIAAVRQHFDWSGKDCPRLLRPRWQQFLAMIQKELFEMTEKEKQPKQNTSAWKLDGLKYLHAEGVVSDFDGWAAKIDEPLPAWAIFKILENMDRKRKG